MVLVWGIKPGLQHVMVDCFVYTAKGLGKVRYMYYAMLQYLCVDLMS